MNVRHVFWHPETPIFLVDDEPLPYQTQPCGCQYYPLKTKHEVHWTKLCESCYKNEVRCHYDDVSVFGEMMRIICSNLTGKNACFVENKKVV
jgi:hypothetical protein